MLEWPAGFDAQMMARVTVEENSVVGADLGKKAESIVLSLAAPVGITRSVSLRLRCTRDCAVKSALARLTPSGPFAGPACALLSEDGLSARR